MDTAPNPLPEHWVFDFTARQLRTAHVCIDLTSTESLLIKTLMLSHSRICSKQQLILGMDKDIHRYKGLEMCLSRLQNKFKDALGERLFKSVRNCGYCLVQDLKPVLNTPVCSIEPLRRLKPLCLLEKAQSKKPQGHLCPLR